MKTITFPQYLLFETQNLEKTTAQLFVENLFSNIKREFQKCLPGS